MFGRGRQALHRLRRLVGPDDPRPRASGRWCAPCRSAPRAACRSARRPRSRSSSRDAICELVPSIELVRLVSSGTEATMSAIRLARGFTGRDKIVKFEGCYHGHADSLLVKAGSGALTFGKPTSRRRAGGARRAHARRSPTTTSPQVRGSCSRRSATQIACVIVEPVAGNMNCVLPRAGIPRRRCATLCDQHGARADLRRSDDRLSRRARRRAGAVRHHAGPDDARQDRSAAACRSARSAARARHHGTASRRSGPVYQAGTLSGNPVAVAAGLATLAGVCAPGFSNASPRRRSG